MNIFVNMTNFTVVISSGDEADESIFVILTTVCHFDD
jgi:hypothetical protein